MSRLTRTLLFSSKGVLVSYCLLYAGINWPFLVSGEVIAPYRQFQELALTDTSGAQQIENRKFSDFGNSFIPEIHAHLNGPRSGWLTLWTDQNELGRPTYHVSGLSPAYPPSWLIGRLTADPWRFITALSLCTCFFAGLLMLLFCLEAGLSPLAGLVAGTTYATCPLFMYWLAFPMFPAVWCWAAGALWGVTRIANKPDLAGWSILAFSIYSLLMTAYPQPVVFHAYILSGYGTYLAFRKRQAGWRETRLFLANSASAVAAGAALVTPVYVDLLHTAAESARTNPDLSFFTAVLPVFGSLTEALRFLVLSTLPDIFGNPIEPNYPFPYDGLSVTPLVGFLAVIGLLVSYRQTRGWWFAILVICLFAFIHPLYELGIEYLGFGLSRSTPLGSILLPLTVIVAYGVDALVQRSATRKVSHAVLIAAGGMLVLLALGLGFGLNQKVTIHWNSVLVILAIAVLLSSQYRRLRPVLLITVLMTTMATSSFPLILRQDPENIARTSPLTDRVRNGLGDGSRFATADPGLKVLPPNLNAGTGLASVHSYNSLSPTRYHALIHALGGEMHTYGRWNDSISPDYNSTVFWLSNIGLILSPQRLTDANLEYLQEESGVHLHKVVSRMGEALQIVPPVAGAGNLPTEDLRLSPRYDATKLVDLGDLLEFRVTPGAASMLVLSQKYHRDWHAQALGQAGWIPARTTAVSGIFQGVLLPGNTQRVRLEFKPRVRHAWIAHCFWILLLALLGLGVLRKKKRPW